VKKALLVGINKYEESPLRGCLNDLRLIREYLTGYFGFAPEHIIELKNNEATKDGILNHLQQMIRELNPGDILFFHYSGHGSYIPDRDFDEDDNKDEILCAYDIDWNNPIVDDDLHKIYSCVPKDATLVITMDCCHSGTNYRNDRVRNRFLPPPAHMGDRRKLLRKPKIKISYGKDMGTGNVICMSSCAADQSCADAYIYNDYYGAFTFYV
jgi:hypothetical protein